MSATKYTHTQKVTVGRRKMIKEKQRERKIKRMELEMCNALDPGESPTVCREKKSWVG